MTNKRFSVVCCVTDWYIEDKLISPFAVLTLHQASDLLNELYEENEQLQKQIKVYEYFLDQNDLDIEWSCLCTADECHISEDMDFDCKDCNYMELKE